MWNAKRLGIISFFVFIFWLLVMGIFTETYAQETVSSSTEIQVTSSTDNNEIPPTSSTENTASTFSSTVESSAESLTNTQETLKGTTVYGSELLTSVSITDSAHNPIHRIKSSDKVKINYSFYLPDEAQSGDTLIFELPPSLQMVNYNDFPLLSNNGSEIGRATIDPTSNKVTVLFNQYVTDHKSISGQFFFWVKLVKDKTVEGVNPIPLPVKGTTSDLELTVTKTNGVNTGITNPTTIFKSGKFDSIDSQKINWTITINNTGQNLLAPIIYDQLGEGQTLLSDTFNVNYRDTDKKSLKKYSLPSKIENDLTKVEWLPDRFTLFLENLGRYSENNHYVSAVINYSTRVTDPAVKYVNSASTLDEDGALQSRNASLTNYANGGMGNGDVNQAIDAVSDKLDEVESIDLDELTDSSVKNLIDAKENAQTMIENETSTASDLEAATEQLVNQLITVEEIAQPTDIQELETIIEQTNDLKEGDYTPESWNPWINKKTEAIALIAEVKEMPKTVSRKEVNQLTQEVITAKANLVEMTLPSETSESISSETSTAETTNPTLYNSNSSTLKNTKKDNNQQRLLETGETRSTSLIIIGALLLILAARIIHKKHIVEK
ncbi:Ig-like domain-containing protein [Enterococcus rotai]|uniref:Ig-like domain-containing protein n=1 Tax=Enterococcus rotai TaxID=118060 RepID=UPI0035C677FF